MCKSKEKKIRLPTPTTESFCNYWLQWIGTAPNGASIFISEILTGAHPEYNRWTDRRIVRGAIEFRISFNVDGPGATINTFVEAWYTATDYLNATNMHVNISEWPSWDTPQFPLLDPNTGDELASVRATGFLAPEG